MPVNELLEDQDEMDLPPLDSDEEEGTEEAATEDLPTLPEDDADALDDLTAADLDVGVEIADPAADAAAENEDLEAGVDVGPLEEGIQGDPGGEDAGDDDDGGLEANDDDLSGMEDGEDDRGLEGTDEPIEDEVDDARLPDLDSDEDGDWSDESEPEAAAASAEGELPPWNDARWEAREGAGAEVPCRTVAVARGNVAAAGDALVLVGDGAHAAERTGLALSAVRAGGGAVSVALADGLAFVATMRGGILVCEGNTATPMPGWRTRPGGVELCVTPSRLWILGGGTLWCSTPLGPREQPGAEPHAALSQPVPVRERGVGAIAASGGVLVALTTAAAGPKAGAPAPGARETRAGGIWIERLRADDEGWRSLALEGEALQAASGEVLLAATAGGRTLALAGRDRVCISRDEGRTFESLALPGVCSIAFAGDDESADLLVLVARDTDDVAHLVQVSARGGATCLAAIGAPWSVDAEDAGRQAALAWDSSRELVWVACRGGLSAYGPARRH